LLILGRGSEGNGTGRWGTGSEGEREGGREKLAVPCSAADRL